MKPLDLILGVLGPQARSLTFSDVARQMMRQRDVQDLTQNDDDVALRWAASVSGIGDLLGLVGSAILDGYRNAADSLAGVYQTINAPSYALAELGAITVHPRLERIARGGIAPEASYGISATGYRLAKFGCQFLLDEQCLLDTSPLSVYLNALQQTGAAVRRLVSDLLWTTLLGNPTLGDGTALFDASRGNYASGGGSALGQGSLDTAMGAIAGQVGKDEEGRSMVHLNLTPKFLITPPALLGAGRRLAAALDTGDGSPLVVRAESRLGTAGLVDPIDEDGATVAGNNTNWLLAAPPEQAPGLVLALLNGKAEPSIRDFELDAGQYGRGFDVSLSVAVTAVDGKPLYWSVGA